VDRGIVTLDLTLLNQRGETVQAGENDLMVHRRVA
jgi:acyl dehydratase